MIKYLPIILFILESLNSTAASLAAVTMPKALLINVPVGGNSLVKWTESTVKLVIATDTWYVIS